MLKCRYVIIRIANPVGIYEFPLPIAARSIKRRPRVEAAAMKSGEYLLSIRYLPSGVARGRSSRSTHADTALLRKNERDEYDELASKNWMAVEYICPRNSLKFVFAENRILLFRLLYSLVS